MGERDVNAALAAANPTEALSPRELCDIIADLRVQLAAQTARAESAEALARRLAVMLHDARYGIPLWFWEALLAEPAVVALLKKKADTSPMRRTKITTLTGR